MKKISLLISLTILTTCLVLLNQANISAADDAAPPTALERLTKLPYLESDVGRQQQPLSPVSTTLSPWSRLVFQSFRDLNWEIYANNQAGSGQIRLTSHGASDIHPRFNRGATRIVFASNRTGSYELYTMNANGSGLNQLTFTGAHNVNPAWSPDGREIAFESYRDGQPEIYVMNADGSNLRRLTVHADFDGMPAWSPGGSKIAFSSNRSGGFRIYVMNANGSGVTPLSSQPYSLRPAWSPDGTRIAYDADGNNNGWQELWLMNADGSGQSMAYNPGAYSDAWARSWSPDGRYIAFTEIQFVEYAGNWYWTSAYFQAYDTVYTNYVVGMGYGNTEWNPDWQTVDTTPPQTRVLPLPLYSQIPHFHVTWEGTDAESGIAGFDVQYRTGQGGSWTNWQTNTLSQTMPFPATAGATVYFRSRAIDRHFNQSGWPAAADAMTTFYTWPLVGRITDNRGVPLANAPVSILPTPLNDAVTNSSGRYHAYLGSGGAHTLDIMRPGYGDLPATLLDQELLQAIYLAPQGNVIQNGSFEAANPLDNWHINGSLPVSASSNGRHTGNHGLLMGQACAYPCLAPAGELPGNSVLQSDAATDSRGNLHFVWIDDGATLYSYRSAVTATWSPEVALSSPGNSTRAAVDPADTLHVTWARDGKIYHRQKPLSASWTAATVVGSLPQPAIVQYEIADILSDDLGGLHLLVKGRAYNAYYYLFYVERRPDGSWLQPRQLTAAVHSSAVMALDADGTLHFVWKEIGGTHPPQYTVRYQTRSAGEWSRPQPLFVNLHHEYTWVEKLIIAPDGTTHLFWRQEQLNKIYHSRQHLNGAWTTPVVVFDGAPFNIGTALDAAADSQGNLHLALRGRSANYEEVSFYTMWKKGEGWQTAVSLPAEFSNPPSIAVDRYDNMHVINSSGPSYHTVAAAGAGGMASIGQRVTIPADMLNPTLAFMQRRIGDTPSNLSGLTLAVSDDDVTNTVPLPTGLAVWSLAWIDMTAWAGQTITLTFQFDQQAEDVNVQIALDTISLTSAYPDTWVNLSGADAALPGETVVFRLTFGNQGMVIAHEAVVALDLPDSLIFVSADMTPTLIGSAIEWAVGDLAAGSPPVTILVTTAVSPAATLLSTVTATATIGSVTPELESGNNMGQSDLFIGRYVYLPAVVR
jgi:hypothetical protein